MNDIKSEPIVYKTSLVAFIDVMGFKELLGNAEAHRLTISKYFKMVKDIISFDKLIAMSKLDVITISDSIIYSVALEGTKEEQIVLLNEFIDRVSKLQFELAVHLNLWVRGGISIGPLFIDSAENQLVGQGYVDAFNLESLADYPRIILDPKIFRHFECYPHELQAKLVDSPIIMPRYSAGPFDFSPWGTDYAMIDWLKVGLKISDVVDTSVSMFSFFQDLKHRFGLDAKTSVKAHKLLRYFVESVHIQNSKMSSSGKKLLFATGFEEIKGLVEDAAGVKF